MRGRWLTFFAAVWLGGALAPSYAADTVLPHPIVPGFERFYANSAADRAAGGRLLLGELNCVACHQAEDAAKLSILPRQAPILDSVGQRIRPEYLREFLASPRTVKPGTVMPDLLAGLPGSERERHVEALVHFLASTGSPRELAVLASSVARGEALFHQVGCVACHQPRQGETPPLAASVPLGDLTSKYTLPGLTSFLRDPLHVRPSGRMPSLNLTDEEARDVASFLLRDLETPDNVRFAYYEGVWSKLPDFDKLTPKATDTAPGVNVGVASRRDGFGLRFEAILRIDTPGFYRFHLGSDDGAQLWIDGVRVVDHDGVHGTTWKDSTVRLARGARRLRVDYFEQAGEETLSLEYEGPDGPRRPVNEALSLDAKEAPRPQRGFRVDRRLAEDGRKLFASLGCASCHAMKVEKATIQSELSAPPLAKLKPQGGCVGEVAARGAPYFGLSSQQKLFLNAAVEAAGAGELAPLPERAAVSHYLTAFNCYACHERDRVGGVEPERNGFFVGAIPEMGDEGRIPPHLTGVGDKLRPRWLQQVFEQGAKDRPYMLARMPKFGKENVGALVSLLPKVDARPALPRPEIDQSPRRVKGAGHQLVGEGGLSCVKCHTFADLGSTGIQAIRLDTMHRRLNEGWFHRYLLDPTAFRPGTRMPAPWPGGVSLLPDLLDGDAHQQIHAVWAYLADGSNAAIPQGLARGAMELAPTADRAIVYRNFIDGAGPRAIGVGYPEGANVAFDANGMRLALLWQGAFIDASRHWSARGAGFQGPLGRNVLQLPEGAPLAHLSAPQATWPTEAAKEQGYQFLGYRLDDKGRPTFLYEYADVRVEDFPEAVSTDEEPLLRRTFRLSHNDELSHKGEKGEGETSPLWLRAAVAGSIEQDGAWFLIDNDWRIRVETSDARPVVRESGGRQELLLPIRFQDHAATVVQEYRW